MTKKIDGSALIFDEEDVKSFQVQQSQALLPKLFRIIFYGEGITNNAYLTRYNRYLEQTRRDWSRSEFSSTTTSHRKAFLGRKITFKLFYNVIQAMGYDIECVSIRMRDRVSGEVHTYSTDDTVEDLDKYIKSKKDISMSEF